MLYFHVVTSRNLVSIGARLVVLLTSCAAICAQMRQICNKNRGLRWLARAVGEPYIGGND
jgi:hypothetical protein